MDVPHAFQAALPQLSIFLAVARHQSFSAAARELRISTSAVSQAVRKLEEVLRVVLLRRTTRAVTLTEAGTRLVAGAGSPVRLALDALAAVSSKPGELAGRVKVCAPQAALALVLEPVVPVFRRRFPSVSLEVMAMDTVGDFVADGYDAAFAVSEIIERDMVRVRLTESFRYLVAGSPDYLARHGAPRKPEDLLEHECINVCWRSGAAPYAWELERGRRKWRVPVRGGIVTNDPSFYLAMAEQGMGLVYGAEIGMRDRLADGRLVAVLSEYAPVEQGIFLCFPSREQQSPALRQFVSVAKEVLRPR